MPRLLDDEPRELVGALERRRTDLSGVEVLAGYGVMGQTFASGHVLALRRFPVSSFGPGYTAVWHRDPEGQWIVYGDVPMEYGCARYLGCGPEMYVEAPITIRWSGSRILTVGVGAARLAWTMRLQSSPATRILDMLGRRVPESVWRADRAVSVMERGAGWLLRAGRVNLVGTMPGGYRFQVQPHHLWLLSDAYATLDGEGLGTTGPLPVPGRLGELRIPQRGIFATVTVRISPERAA